MATVRRLPDDLANQIAAGEVVERPASAVKELVENALDAGATRIRVAIEQGGLSRISVSDDGEGMGEADARLALERHATSKISRIDDLSRLVSFGFRGEALPSIASVSRLTLTTRARGTDEGVELTVEGGGPARVRPAGSAVGTTCEVVDLFYNVPARRKFLKAVGTESAHVTEALTVAALARPEVTFLLQRDGKNAREWLRAASRAERAAAVFPDETLATLSAERGPIKVDAYLAAPERARSGMGNLYILVNGRPVRDRALGRAVAQAYGSVLEPGRYPLGVVYVELSPAVVDVNVHPQKAEVRFADARFVFEGVTRALHDELAKAFRIPSLGPPGQPWRRPAPFAPLAPAMGPMFGAPAPGDDPWGLSAPETIGTPYAPPGAGSASSGQASLADIAASAANAASALASGAFGTNDPAAQEHFGGLEFLVQVRLTFLICTGEEGLYILDQHAAAERVTFDRMRRAYQSKTVAMQRLLVPELVELVASEVALLEEQAADVSALGLEVRAVGATTVAVHAVPTLLQRAHPQRLVRDLASELAREAGRPFGGAVDLVLATMACHGSVRAGDKLSATEAQALLRALDDVEFAGHCPHGRPVVMRLPWSELERRVGR